MDTTSKHFERLPFYLSFAAAAAGIVSIAACHILMGAAIVALLWRGERFRLPRVWIPLALFAGWTLLSLALSEDPAAGWPQVKKFYVLLMLFIVYNGVRKASEAGWVLLALVAGGCVSAAWSLVQFVTKYERALETGEPFYQSYVAARITGTMSHWNTFAGLMMIALAAAAAYLLFGGERKWAPAAALIALALVLNFTRAMWGGAAAGLAYLIWSRKPWAVLALPAALAAIVLFAPEPVHTRVRSMWNPDPKLDSNEHRVQLRKAGLRMIAAHPLFGVGPMLVKRHVLEFAAEDAPKPWPAGWWYDHLHNLYIHYAAERGIPAMLAFVCFLGTALWQFAGAARKAEPERRWILHAAAASIIGVMVGGWWEVNLGDSEVLQTFLAVVGCGYAALEDRNHRPGGLSH
jgi:O-antigen ligase